MIPATGLHQRLGRVADGIYSAITPITESAESLEQVAEELAQVLFTSMEATARITDAGLFKRPDLRPYYKGGPGVRAGERNRLENTILKILQDTKSREQPGVRIDRLIRTELARAERKQAFRSMKTRGVTHYEWVEIPESCQECIDQAGQPISIDVYPLDLHVRCDCIVVPIENNNIGEPDNDRNSSGTRRDSRDLASV